MSKQNGKAGLFKRFLLVFLLIGPASLLVLMSSRGCQHKFKELDDMGPMPAYSFKDIHGKTYTNGSFKNQIVLFTTLQETCPDSCAMSFWYFDQIIYQHVRKNHKKLGHVRIVSFVTDQHGNPSQGLKDMEFTLRDRVESYDPKIWILAEGDAKQVYNIRRNGTSLLQKGDSYFGGEAFQELMLLSDKSNHLRMVMKGTGEGAIRRMKEHMALLDKQYDKAAYTKKHKK